MNNQNFKRLLKQLGACREGYDWVSGRDLSQTWDDLERADWLLWLAGSMADKPGWNTRQEIVLAACDCAETALKYVAKGENRPRMAIESARNWAKNPTEENRIAAGAAAGAAEGAAAWAAAGAAAWAAARAAWAAAGAAARAAAGAAEAAGDSDFKKQLCELIRSRLIFDAIK